MNPSAYGALPSSACTLGTEGSQGPDRITRNVYDAAGQVTTLQKAYGTALQEDYAGYQYSLNGKQTRLTDANGNPATMTYDGFDRQVQWNFPSAATPGAVSTTDYEAYGYDANGNRISLRKRDGSVIGYSYDALNRMSVKDIPGGTSADVYYASDLDGHQTSARFGSSSGSGLSETYDGFGRLASATNDLSGSALTLSYLYDADGNRVRVTHPGGTYFTFDYDGLDRQSGVRENGSALVATVAYDNQGRRSGDTRGAASTSYGYDAVSRPTSIADDLAGSSYDVTTTLSYNPVNQIVGKGRSNDAYAFSGYATVSRTYATNGLNQYTTAGPATFSYDANGNLTGDGTSTFTYDVENRLVTRSGGLALAYDPNGRLWQTSGGATGTTRYLYDGDQLTLEADLSGNVLRRYVHGPGEDDPILWYEGTGLTDRRSLQIDSQGSIVSIADASGTALTIDSYDEYGIPSAGNAGRFQYTGQAWLPDLGMYYYKARIYSPTLGRFLQTDPIGYKDQANLYGYVGNDPVNKTDPSGQYERDVHFSLTYVLALAAGYSPRMAYRVASADQGVDDNPATSPMHMSPVGEAVRIRANFHFTSPARRAQMYGMFQSSRSAKALGQYLHAEQDSYSHAGYGPRWGHAIGASPHAPDRTSSDVGKADSMARDTYNVLVNARTALGEKGPVVPFSQIAASVHLYNSASSAAGKVEAGSKIIEDEGRK